MYKIDGGFHDKL